MGVLKPYLITVFLLLVIVDVALSRHYYRWFRFGRFQRDLRRCNRQSILDKLCPEVPEDDPCANVDCSCSGICQDGSCTCDAGFTGANCETEDICILDDFCMNGATCDNNACMCTEQFTGERCETCTNFQSTFRLGFSQLQFEVTNTDPVDVSCDAFCSTLEGCTATAFINGQCEFYKFPLIAADSLAPSPTISECETLCINTEGCRLGLLQTNLVCFSLNATAEDVEFGVSTGSVFVLEPQCDEN